MLENIVGIIKNGKDIIIGAILGGVISAVISHQYYKKSGKDLQKATDELTAQLTRLDEINSRVERWMQLRGQA